MLSRGNLDLLDEYGAPKYRRTVNAAGRDTTLNQGAPFFTLSDQRQQRREPVHSLSGANGLSHNHQTRAQATPEPDTTQAIGIGDGSTTRLSKAATIPPIKN